MCQIVLALDEACPQNIDIINSFEYLRIVSHRIWLALTYSLNLRQSPRAVTETLIKEKLYLVQCTITVLLYLGKCSKTPVTEKFR